MTSPQTPENQSVSPSPGYTATFHLPDGSRVIVAVAGAVAFSCGGDRGPTRLVILGPDRRVRARGDLDALLRRAGLG